jgi:hypothetical protein
LSDVPIVLSFSLLILGPALLRWCLATAACLLAPRRRRAPAELRYPLSYDCSQCQQHLRWNVSVCPECGQLRLWPIGMAAAQASYIGGAAILLERSGAPAQFWWLPKAGAALSILSFAMIALEIARAVSRATDQRRRTRREVDDFLAGRQSLDLTEENHRRAGLILATVFVVALAVTATMMAVRIFPKSSIIAAAIATVLSFAAKKSTTIRDPSGTFGSARRLNHAQFAQWIGATLEYGASRQYMRILLDPSVPVPIKFRMQRPQLRAWGHVHAWWTTPVVLASVIGVLTLLAQTPHLVESGPTWPTAIVLGAFVGGACGRFWRWLRTLRHDVVLA